MTVYRRVIVDCKHIVNKGGDRHFKYRPVVHAYCEWDPRRAKIVTARTYYGEISLNKSYRTIDNLPTYL